MRSLIALVMLGAAFAAGCGGSEGDESNATTAPAPAPDPAETEALGQSGRGDPDRATGGDGNRQGPSSAPAPTPSADQDALEAAVRDYVAAVDAGDGEAVCVLLAAGTIEAVELPRKREDCAGMLAASIGYRDPRGVPVFEGAEVAAVGLVEVEGDAAKAVVTVVTEFADRPEPSIEDDGVYLRRDRGWRIAKPSATLYRAVGIPDVPPSVLAPPR